MFRLWVLCLVVAIWTPAECIEKRLLFNEEVCYGDLGCFNTKAPFWSLQRPIPSLPENPTKINTRFLLYTRDNQASSVELKHTNVAAGNFAPFKSGLPTKFVVHGFQDNANSARMSQIRAALMRKASMNIIMVDWSGGNQFPYTQATSNCQVVGAEIARLVNALTQRGVLTLANVHIIGHSLGAHVAGYAGQRVRTIGRITGLDPAEPYFQNTDPIVRLDKTDAALVDVIHTDGSSMLELGLGMSQAIGHFDFYPNGGLLQPGCPKDLSKLTGGVTGLLSLNANDIDRIIGCSHDRSVDYFVESVDATTCNFIAYPCANNDDFKAGKCTTCAGGSCPTMGFKADQFRGAQGSYYLTTKASAPFCK